MIPIRGLRACVSPWQTPTPPVALSIPEPLRLVPPPSTSRDVIKAVAARFRITPEELTGRSRKAQCVLARAVVIRLLRDRRRGDGEPSYSTTQIGWALGRDHSTICHALDHFEMYLRLSPVAAEVYEDLRELPR